MKRFHAVALQALILVTLSVVIGRHYIFGDSVLYDASSETDVIGTLDHARAAHLLKAMFPNPDLHAAESTTIEETREGQITSTSATSSVSILEEPSQTIPTPDNLSPTPTNKDGDQEFLLREGVKYLQAIWDPADTTFPRLSCPAPAHDRYDYLKPSTSPWESGQETRPKYFFALDLYTCAPLLPRLLGTLVETIRFLGPSNCALSIVEGRSHDGTFEILQTLRPLLAALNTTYHFTTNAIDPKAGNGVDRVEALAMLRNQALQPLIETPEQYAEDTTVLFVNDVALCMEDVLELIHQKIELKADMTCAMDWIDGGTSFYDVWVSRTIDGDQFFEIPQSASWEFHNNLFWNEPKAKTRFEAKEPFQVYACWNGVTAFTAKPIMEGRVKFRTVHKNTDECYMGEPTLFCKDMWKEGYGKVAVVPSVNVGYDDEESLRAKLVRGTVSDYVEKKRGNQGSGTELIDWQLTPPALVKCVPTYERPAWVPWDQGLEEFQKKVG